MPQNPRSQPKTTTIPGDSDPIDTAEVLPYPIPEKLLERVTQYQPTLETAGIMYAVGESGSFARGREILRWKTPMDVEPEAICQQILELMYGDVRKREEKRSEPATAYRAVLGTRQSGRTYYRYADLETRVGDGGELVLRDSSGSAESGALGASKVLVNAVKAHAEISLDCHRAVADSVKGYAAVGEALQKMGEGYAKMAEAAADGQARLIDAHLQVQNMKYDHEARMQRDEAIGRIFEKAAAGPLGREIGHLLRDLVREARQPKPNGRDPSPQPEPTTFSGRLRSILDAIPESRRAAFEALLSEDEKTILGSARRTETDDGTFASYAQKLLQIWGDMPDAEQHSEALENALGPELTSRLHALFEDVATWDPSDASAATAGL